MNSQSVFVVSGLPVADAAHDVSFGMAPPLGQPASGSPITTRWSALRSLAVGVLLVIVAMAAVMASAADSSWNVNASGDWTNAANWLAGVPGANPGTTSADVATFTTLLTGVGKTVTVDTGRNIGGITFGSASGGNTGAFGYTLIGGSLLLSSGGSIQTLLADGAHMESIVTPVEIQGSGGTATFAAGSTNANNILNIGAVTGVSTAGQTTALTLNGANVGGSEVSGTIGDGSAGGNLSLAKSGAGAWYLAGSNTYTGGTSITAGTLVAQNSTALGTGNISFGGGTLQYAGQSAATDWASRFKSSGSTIALNTNYKDVTLAGVIDSTNTAGLTKTGGGILTLSGANTYTGVTTIGPAAANNTAISSFLRLNNALALGGGGNLTFTGGTLRYTGNNKVDYSGRIVGSTGAINIDTNGQSVTFASALAASNNQGLTKLGAGTLTLSGAANNAYTGTTTLSGGTLRIDNTTDNAADRLSSGTMQINSGSFVYDGNAAANSTESVGGIGVGGAATFTINYGGTQQATITSTGTLTRSSVGLPNNVSAASGTMLMNGMNLGMDSASTTSVARVLLASAPTLVGTTAGTGTGLNAAVQNTQIVPFLVGEAAATSGGLGTATGTPNTFLTYNATTGVRPLNPVDEFTANAITAGNNTRITAATTVATNAAVNSLVIAGGNLTINDVDSTGAWGTLTNTSAALLFTSSNSINSSGTAGRLSFGATEAQITVNQGVTATINARLSGTSGSGAGLSKSGPGTLNLNGVSSVTGGFTVEGGGTVNVNAAYTGNNSGPITVGASSAGNTVNVSGVGTLQLGAATLNLGYGVYGNNSLTVSTPGGNRGNAPLRFNNVWVGGTSSNNSLTISNGAYASANGNGGTNSYRLGQNAGANSNTITVTGAGSVFDKTNPTGGGSPIQIGDSGNSNSFVVSDGGTVMPVRWSLGSAGGSSNSLLITGNRSSSFVNSGSNSWFELAVGSGASGNTVTTAAGAVFNYSGTGTGRLFAIGAGIGADENAFIVTGLGSLARVSLSSGLPISLGGRAQNATPTDGGIGNRIDVYDKATLWVDSSIFVLGTNSSLNIGNGTGISTVTTGAASGLTSNVYLRNASGRLNFNSGRLIAGAAGDLVSGPGQVVLNGPAYVSTAQTNSKIASLITGSGDLVKEGTGTLILSEANTYVGATRVTNGTLALDYTVVGGKLADVGTLALGGGTLDLRNGTSSHVEVVAGTSLGAGRGAVTRSAGTSTLRMNAIAPGVGILNIGAAGIADTDSLNDASDAGGILGPWATVAGTDWAVNSTNATDGPITAYASYTDYDALGSTIASAAGNNARFNSATGSGNVTLGAATTTVNTLLQSASVPATIDTANAALVTNGIMIGSAGESLTIGVAAGDGSLTTATSNSHLVLNSNNALRTITVNAPILANGSSGLATAGSVVLNGINTYTGPTGVGGSLTIGNAGQLSGGTYAGDISIAAVGNFTMDSSANQILGGVISGDGGFTQSGAGTTTLAGANTFTGPVTVNGGVLQAGSSSAFGPAFTAAVTLSNSGKVQLGGNNVTLNSLASASTNAVIESGSATAGTDMLTVNAFVTSSSTSITNTTTSYSSYAGLLQDGGARKLSLQVNGSSGLILSGTNTYSGGTTVNGATIVLGNTSGFGTGPVTLASGSVLKQLSTASGTVANPITLSGGEVVLDMRLNDGLTTPVSTFNDMTLTGNISGPGRLRVVGDASGKTLTLSGAKTFSGGIIQSGQSNAYNTPGGTAYLDRYTTVAIDNAASLGTGRFYAQISSANVSTTVNNVTTGLGTLKTLANLSAGNGVANAIDLGPAARLVVEADGSNAITLSGTITGSGDLYKIGSSALSLKGINAYAGATFVNAGTLRATNSRSLGSTSGATVAAGASLAYAATSDAQLPIFGNLAITAAASGTQTRIGGSVGSTATSASIVATGNATTTGASGAIQVDIYGIPGVTPTSGTYTLVKGTGGSSALNVSTLNLGTIYNPTNFTVGSLSSSTTEIRIGITAQTALTSIYYKGGATTVTPGAWALSDGSTDSNWASDNSTFTTTSLTPGTSSVAIFDTAFTSNLTGMTLGYDMSVKGVQFTGNAFQDMSMVGTDSYTLTIGSSGIVADAGAGAIDLSPALIRLGAAQTWTNNSSSLLNIGAAIESNGQSIVTDGTGNMTIGGVISGLGGLVKQGSGLLSLTGSNTYSGNTLVSGGTLNISSPFLADASTLNVAAGATFNLGYAGVDTIASLFLGGSEQPGGTWGAIGSGAQNESTYLTGTGLLNVTSAVPEPGTMALVAAAGLALAAAARRRR